MTGLDKAQYMYLVYLSIYQYLGTCRYLYVDIISTKWADTPGTIPDAGSLLPRLEDDKEQSRQN